MELHTWAVEYIHAFELFQKSARIDLSQGYQEGRWTGSVNGVRESIQRKGMPDSLMSAPSKLTSFIIFDLGSGQRLELAISTAENLP